MPKSSRPAPIPDWLKPTLKKIPLGAPAPDTLDFQIVSAALAGVELKELKARFKVPGSDILTSVERVTSAVREQRVEGEVFEKFPDLKALMVKRKHKDETPPSPLFVITDGLPEIIEGDDESFHNFLMAAKTRQARTLIPAALAALERNLYNPFQSHQAISKSLEMYYGVGKRGPGVAVQINNGGDKEKSETPHFFEETILDAEVAEGSKGGETTVFDERLLGQQNEEQETT